MKNYKTLTDKYFEAFLNKDVETLNELYSNNITLIDWNINVNGKEEVLLANQGLFDLDFTLEVHNTNQSEDKTFNEITITIGEEVLNIMDVITFDENFKIIKIVAYKR